MFFRFGAVVCVLVAIALAAVAIEKRSLALRRAISLQEYRLQQLLEQRARLRLRVEQLSAPERLLQVAGEPGDETR
jgi:hypothetical protein